MQPITVIHLFAAVLQALLVVIGQRLSARPAVVLVELRGRKYHPSYALSYID